MSRLFCRTKLPPIYNVVIPSLVDIQKEATVSASTPSSRAQSSVPVRNSHDNLNIDKNVRFYKYNRNTYGSIVKDIQPEFVIDDDDSFLTNQDKTNTWDNNNSSDSQKGKPFNMKLASYKSGNGVNLNSNNSTIVIQPHSVILHRNNEVVPLNRNIERVKQMGENECVVDSAIMKRVQPPDVAKINENTNRLSARVKSNRTETLMDNEGLSISGNSTLVLDDDYRKHQYRYSEMQRKLLRQKSTDVKDCVEELDQEQKIKKERAILESTIRKVSVYQPALSGKREKKWVSDVDLSYLNAQKTMPSFNLFSQQSLPPIVMANTSDGQSTENLSEQSWDERQNENAGMYNEMTYQDIPSNNKTWKVNGEFGIEHVFAFFEYRALICLMILMSIPRRNTFTRSDKTVNTLIILINCMLLQHKEDL